MIEKKKIIVDIDRMKYPNTGMFEFCFNLYKLFKNNNDFQFIFYKHKKTLIDDFSKFINITFFDRIVLIVSSKYDIWHTTNQLATKIPINAKKLVYTIHDLNFLYTNKSKSKKEKILTKIQCNINKSDYLTFISEFSYNDVKKRLNIEGKKYKIIYNGVSIKEPKRPPIFLPNKPFIFTLGVIDPKKNIHTILYLLQISDYDLVISGKTTNKIYLKSILSDIKNMNLENRVFFTGEISENDKYWYLKKCEAFIFPSLSEGFGIPPIEAMRFGKPVFLSNLTSLPEIGGSSAYYFDDFTPKKMQEVFINGMKEYANNTSKKEQIINWSLQFTWEKASEEYLAIYNELL